MSNSAWFPKPKTAIGLFVAPQFESRKISPNTIFSLLMDDGAVEWRDKVNVTPPADGSAKPTTRLLQSGDWVFKTDLAHADSNMRQVLSRMDEQIAREERLKIWHPQKYWFLIHNDDQYWPCSACPEMRTLRQLPTWREKLFWWGHMFVLAIKMMQEFQVSLDLNPSNFALTGENKHLYYLDDEVYTNINFSILGQAIAERIPEELEIDEQNWYNFGLFLNQLFMPKLTDISIWHALIDGANDFPLIPELDLRRVGLVHGLLNERFDARTADSGTAPVDEPVADEAAAAAGHRDAPPAAEHGDTAAAEDPSFTTPPTEQAPPVNDPPSGDQQANGQYAHTEKSGPRQAGKAHRPGIKICVFSDVHANYYALDAVLAEAARLGARRYICLGDIVGYGPHPSECIRRVANLPHVILVQGRHDRAVGTGNIPANGNKFTRIFADWTRGLLRQSEIRWLSKIPVDHLFKKWMLIHGAPKDPDGTVYQMTFEDNLKFMADLGLNVAFHGRTNVPVIYKKPVDGQAHKVAPAPTRLFRRGETLLINPGSVGQPRDGDRRAAFLMWDTADNTITFHRVEYPFDETIASIIKTDLPADLIHSLASRIEIGR